MALISGALVVLTLTATCLFTGYRVDWLFVRWADTRKAPFKVISALEIASRWSPLKSASAFLVCGEDGAHLMVKGRLPMGSYIRENTAASAAYIASSTVSFDWTLNPRPIFRSFRILSARVELGTIDTIVTAPMRKADRASLLNWFDRGAPQSMRIDVIDEAIVKLKATAYAGEIRDFMNRCPADGNSN